MAKIKRVEISDLVSDDEDNDLKSLLETYLRRSEELEYREDRMMRHVEMMQTAVESLQSWNNSRNSSQADNSMRINIKEVEKETELIKTETEQIQNEVNEKIKENKKLQEEVERRRKIKPIKDKDDVMPEIFVAAVNQESYLRKTDTQEIETRPYNHPSAPLEKEIDPGLQFFNEKLKKLKEMQIKLKKESKEESELGRIRKKSLEEKIELLELESEIDRQLIELLKKKYGRK